MVAAKSTIEKSAPRTPYLSTLEKIKIRNLYLAQCASHQEIAKQLGKSVDQVSRYICNAGLVAIRREREKSALSRADARIAEKMSAVSEVIADECEELALEGLKRARNAVTDTHKDAAKNFQAWTAGIRNVVTARNLAKGIGKADTLGEGDKGSVNLFFMSGGAERREVKVGNVLDEV